MNRIRFDFENILVLLGCLLLLLSPSAIPWISDEPVLLLSAQHCNDSGILFAGGLNGASGVCGPAPVWIYQFLLLLTHNIPLLAFFKTILFGAACLGCLYGIGRAVNQDPRPMMILYLFTPRLWHDSRILEGTCFLVPLVLLAVFSFAKYLRKESWPWLALCTAALVLAVWTHSMAFPAAAAPVLFFLLIRRDLLYKHPRTIGICGLAELISASAVCLVRILKTPAPERGFGAAGFWEAVSDAGSWSAHLSFFGFANDYLAILAESPLEFWFGLLTLTASLVLLILGFIRLVKTRDEIHRASDVQIAWFCLLILLIQTILTAAVRTKSGPLNQTAVLPAALLLAWFGLGRLREAKRQWYLRSFAIVSGLGILIFVRAASITWCAGGAMAPSLSTQWDIAAAMNERMAAGARLALEPDPFYAAYPDALQSQLAFERLCNPRPLPPDKIRMHDLRCVFARNSGIDLATRLHVFFLPVEPPERP